MIFKQNRPQHPDVYVHYLKSDLTAYWLNRALGLLHCGGKTHHEPHRSTPAAQLPWRRLTLMDSEPGCGRTAPVHVRRVLPSMHLTRSSSHPHKNHDGQQALRRYWGQFFTYYKIMRAQLHAKLLNGLLFFSFFIIFFYIFFLHRAFKVFNEERPQHCRLSYIGPRDPGAHASSLLFRMPHETQSSHSTYNS